MKLNSKLQVKIKKKKSFICAFRAGDTKGKLTGILVLNTEAPARATVRRSKCCLGFSVACGGLQISE